ncbi:expressed unknown protein [Seminavis robusta]|uniref:Polycystin cation channel PKD1/PKD2 domain-containing protein n=1 Tax=Seminavis robusta TaxID=568900 RepID=A0A9N8E275_9STRA|nr:expressed unknown protein [Seminavis robusta]|eukprot:Sro482_g151940.2 n/a (345) ;mRNA; r:63240-64274
MYTLVISIFMLTMTVREGSPFSSEEATFWRALTVISIAMTSWALVAFFRLVSVDFAQITNGVVTTAKKIMAFMLAFTIVLVAFAEMLYISTTGTEECTRQSDFCNFFDALLKVYTMSVGEVSEDDIPKNGFSIFLYVVFVYAVVLLLANVLAFIIGNDIWSKEQTSQGFWLNRMNYLAEVGSVFASKKREINFFGGRCEIDLCCEVDCSAASSRTWQKLTSVFEDKGLGTLSPMFWLTMVLRFLSAIALSLWVLIGLGFFGAFWPASVREFLFWVPTKEEKAQANKDVAAKNTTQSVLELELHQVRKDMNAMEEKLSNEIKSMEEKLSKVLALLENQQKTLPAS